MTTLITIANDGPEIVETNYWDTEHARRGFAYLSGNAGTLRLLVPPALEVQALDEMRTGTRVLIEASRQEPGCLDIVFQDGTSSPFALTISQGQMDRKLVSGTGPLAVWTTSGKQLELRCKIKV